MNVTWRISRSAITPLLFMLACGSNPPAATTTVAPSPSAGAGNICAVRGVSPAGPVTDPNGPFFHQVVVATSDDGRTIRDAHQVVDHASVPDGTRLPDGSVGIYYVNASEGGVTRNCRTAAG